MAHCITFVIYRPNSVDGRGDAIFDSMDSDLSILTFSSLETNLALAALKSVFFEDLQRREHAAWVSPVEVTVLIDGAWPYDDRLIDATAIVSQARAAANDAI